MTAGPELVLVPHTHWDREWYEPFQVFRLRLVEVLDDVLARAEADPAFRFTIDGQLAAVEDYLEIRPEHQERLAALVRQGQLAIGPWQILLDEFLCAGETIVRNLQLGTRNAAKLGGAMPVGYLPDMFGHCAQMPQILARAGLAHACLWRGVPGRVHGHGFRWVAPDGSAVRVEYLWDGYGNALDLLADACEPNRNYSDTAREPGQGHSGIARGPNREFSGEVREPDQDHSGNALEPDRSHRGVPERVAEAVREYRAEIASWYGADPVLGMLGSDHSRPAPDLLPLARAAGLPLATLSEYLHPYRPDDPELPLVEGELRSHARGNILPGVISVRVGLKQAMAIAERTAGEAEALTARCLSRPPPPTQMPQWPRSDYARYLELAWHRIIACSAHDSVTGCGVDETADQVESRLAEAAQLGRAVRDRVLDSLAEPVPADAFLIANPSPWPRTVLAELDVPVSADTAAIDAELPDGTRLPVQELGGSETLVVEETLDTGDLDRLLRRIHGRELFGQQIERYTIEPGQATFEVAQVPRTPGFDKAALRDELAKAARETLGTWRVRTRAQPRRRVLVAAPVPASGQVSVRIGEHGPAALPPRPVVSSEPGVLDNQQVRVEVAGDGTLTLRTEDGTTLTGVGRLVDGGDRGDSYNYGPPARDTLVEQPAAVRVTVVEQGPLRGTLEVVREYDWPVGLSGDVDVRAEQTVRVPVTMRVSLSAGEPFVRLALSFVNPAADHRLRLHVPLPAPVTGSAAEGQFGVTSRGLESEGGWGEHPLPTYPASGFVTAGPATVLLDHVREYEVVGGGTELALTLLRAVGWMSVNVHPLRDEPAGSQLPVPGAQYLGRRVDARLAVLPGRGGWETMGAPRHAAEFGHAPQVRRGSAPAGAPLPDPVAGIAVAGDGVTVSALRPAVDGAGELELRLVAMTEQPTTAVITGPFTAARRTDLLGRPGEELPELPVSTDGLRVPMVPWEIATLRLQ